MKHIGFWHVFLFVIISAAGVYVSFFVPIPRQIGLTLRMDLYIFPMLFLAALGTYICCNQIVEGILEGILFTFVILPVSGLWNSGISDQYILGGIIPWSDAFTHQLNTERFLYGGTMGQATALRPISSVLYGLILRLTNNNFLFLYIFISTLIALSIIACSFFIKNDFGPATAAFFYCNAFFYIRTRLSNYMTEPYGFLLGLLSCYCIFNGIQKNSQKLLILGFALMSLSNNVRPGPILLLPISLIWYFFVYMRGKKKRFFYSFIIFFAILSGFLINKFTISQVYPQNESLPNHQFAEIIYGTCLGGKSWNETVGSSEILSLNHSKNYYWDLAVLCINALKAHPKNIFKAFKTIFWNTLIKNNERGAFSYFSGSNDKQNYILRFCLMTFWLIGFILLSKNMSETKYSFLIYCSIGMVLVQFFAAPYTVPLLRFHASSIWIPGLIVGISLQKVYDKLIFLPKENEFVNDYTNIICVTAYVLIFLSLLSPLILKRFPFEIPKSDHISCNAGEDRVFTRIDKGSYIYLQNESDLPYEHIPWFRLPFVRQHFHDTASLEMFDFTDNISKPTAIIRGIDLDNLNDILVFSPLDLVKDQTGYVVFCGKLMDPPILRKDRFFIPTSANFINQ